MVQITIESHKWQNVYYYSKYVHRLPRQLRIVIGRKFFGSSGLPLFLYIGFILPTSQMSGITPDTQMLNHV
jgi:hypothetical protein